MSSSGAKRAAGRSAEEAARKRQRGSSSAASSSSSSSPSDGEPAPRTQGEGRVLDLCKEHPDGVPQAVMQEALDEQDNASKAEMLDAINTLATEQRLQFMVQGDQLQYKLRPAALAAKFRTLSAEDVTVYTAVEQASNKGVWSRDLKRQLHGQVTGPAVDKSLKHLHSKQLIKSVKSIASRSKKVVMLFDLIPSLDVQGRCWFSGHQYDTEFFEQLRAAVLAIVKHRRQASPSMATEEVVASGAFAVAITNDDMLDLFKSLVFEGSIEVVPSRLLDPDIVATMDEDDEAMGKGFLTLYRVRRDSTWGSVLSHVPCTMCPVRDQCVPGGRVNPQACPYMGEWLDF